MKEKVEKTKTHLFTVEKIFDLGWIALIIVTIIGTTMLCLNTQKFITKLRHLNPEYPFPSMSDISFCLILLTIIMTFKIIIESALMHITEKIMDKKFFEPGQDEIRKILKRKLAINMFKFIYYSSATVFGYYVLLRCDYFPKELGGNGHMRNMFSNGYPNSFYFEKPKFLNLYYFVCLSYSFVDLIWLIFIYDRQSDFWNMLLHHLCTSSLIIFSYVTNYSNIGSIVLFLHNATDVVVYAYRIVLYCQVSSIPRTCLLISVLFAFIYGRLFGFGKLIYTSYKTVTWEWGWVEWSLWGFLAFLYIMHANWTFIILKKIFERIVFGTFTDSYKFKKLEETNKNSNKDSDDHQHHKNN